MVICYLSQSINHLYGFQTLYGFEYIIGFEQVNPMPVPPPNIAASMRSKCTQNTEKYLCQEFGGKVSL